MVPVHKIGAVDRVASPWWTGYSKIYFGLRFLLILDRFELRFEYHLICWILKIELSLSIYSFSIKNK